MNFGRPDPTNSNTIKLAFKDRVGFCDLDTQDKTNLILLSQYLIPYDMRDIREVPGERSMSKMNTLWCAQ